MNLESTLKPQLVRFYRWWSGELTALLPEKIQALLDRAKECLLMEVSAEGEVSLHHLQAHSSAPLGRFPLNEAGARERDDFFKRHPRIAELPLAMRLAPGQALRKWVKLPFAAEENLNQVLTFEMDKLTPFKAQQIYFDARVIKRLPTTRQIEVDLVYSPRSKLDAALDELVSFGWLPQTLFIADDERPSDYNLLPSQYRAPVKRWLQVTHLTLGGVAALLVLGLVALPIWNVRSQALELEEQVKRASRVAKAVEALREERDKLIHQSRFLQDRKLNEPVVLDMLEEMTRLIPVNTWLNGLQYKDRHVVIQGQSPSASSLIELIDKSPYFSRTNFVSPVTKDTRNNLERFQIASDVINGRFSEKPD